MARAVVGRPVALQERWNRGDLVVPSWRSITIPGIVDLATSTLVSVTVTTHATPHSKGAWVEVISSLSTTVDGLIFTLNNTSVASTDSSLLLDVGVGAAASEVTVVEGLDIGWIPSSAGDITLVYAPVRLSFGQRIAIRVQGAISSDSSTIRLVGSLRSRSARFNVSTDMIGVSLAGSSGTTLTGPTTNNTYGAWTELVASTTQPYRGFCYQIGYPAGMTSHGGTTLNLIEFGVGASGSEQPIIGPMHVAGSNQERLDQNIMARGLHQVYVARGSRLSARFQCNQTAWDAMSASLIGIPF